MKASKTLQTEDAVLRLYRRNALLRTCPLQMIKGYILNATKNTAEGDRYYSNGTVCIQEHNGGKRFVRLVLL